MTELTTRMMPARRALAGLGFAVLAAAGPVKAVAAEAWGIENEKLVTLTGKVVDLACELRKDCPPACGAGKHQLGILTGDGKLRPAVKGSADFASPQVDLAPLCGKTIEVDGLLIENPAAHILMVQAWRLQPSDPWTKTMAWLADWSARHGKADEWFRADPFAKKVIEENGVFGIKGLVAKE